METLEKRKLNLLVHLAKVDGKFDKSEKDLLREFAREKGLDESLLDENEQPMRITEFAKSQSKIELLYWAIKLMKADKVIHQKEILFCKNMASKLGFDEEVVDAYAYNELPDFDQFENEVKLRYEKSN